MEELILCEWALREGILLDYIHGHPRSLARAEAYPDVRRRSVMALAERCQFDEAHARTWPSWPWPSSTQTQERHGLGDGERALLEYAALLHDIGHHISYPGHHKHTYYLIKNGEPARLRPRWRSRCSPTSPATTAGATRAASHRGVRRPFPARADARCGCWPGCLRLADALDRSHRQIVRAPDR